MKKYGQVQEDYLSPAYFALLDESIQKEGKAEYITALEYHGDDYSMYNGSYSMDPATFRAQVEWFMEEDYHFVTLHELEAFVFGKLDLPAKSVILTSDLSRAHLASLSSMTQTFRELEAKYGYKPHVQVYIFAGDMTPEAGAECADDRCWKMINEARDSGYFTFGSHSYSHQDAAKWEIKITQADFEKANKIIKEKTGLNIYALAWPFESSCEYTDQISKSGFTLGFGGLTRSAGLQLVRMHDTTPMRLPRLLPPAVNGVSIRPAGKTLAEIMAEQEEANSAASTQATPLPAQAFETETPVSVTPTQDEFTASQASGPIAQKLLALEYHGINYAMSSGYSMDPDTFKEEIESLCKEGFHFARLEEVQSLVEGETTLPLKSIFLTSDLSIKYIASLPDTIRIFEEMANKYSCKPYMALFLVSNDLNPENSELCKANACWNWTREALASNYFGLGIHSASGIPIGQADEAWILKDFLNARETVKSETGIEATALSWPSEICAFDQKPFAEAGFEIGFAGFTRTLGEGFVMANDPSPLCLPRMLPPNMEGVSLRPAGASFQDLMELAIKP